MKKNLSSHIKLDEISTHYYRPESELELASLTRLEKIYTKVVETAYEGAQDAALDVARVIQRNVEKKGRCVIGFGSGRSALMIYDELVKLYFADKLSFADVVAFNLSELGLGSVEKGDASTMARLNARLFNKVDIDPANVHSFSQEANSVNVHKLCKAYEREIDEYGGLDLVVCELTKQSSLAFNEPGSASSSMCRLVLLGSEARARVANSFQCEEAPSTAVTLGIANILQARHIIAVAWGDDSAAAVQRAVEGGMSDQAPASFLQLHHSVKVIVDLDAATRLTRISHPWRVTSCEWTESLTRRAIVWLSRQTGKPILKLTNKDYNDYGLGELLALRGSAYDVNILVFNMMQHTITGWPGGKPNADDSSRPERALPFPKRVLIFSPHPDDVIVSMGGTVRRLVQQGHSVYVAVATTGDAHVTDGDLRRYIKVMHTVNEHFGIGTEQSRALATDIGNFLDRKTASDNDTPDVRFIKGAIFACEGIAACNYVGVSSDHVKQLRLPFFVDAPDGEGKTTDADVAVVVDAIRKVRPHQIFFADDLDEPSGTHERVADVVLAALDEVKDEDFMSQCRVWMYRGTWGEWSVDHVEMAVPMSPEEFKYKSDAILRFQSQVGDAPFRDEFNGHLSWQQSLDRNRATAKQYGDLGLASYEAIETFVQYRL